MRKIHQLLDEVSIKKPLPLDMCPVKLNKKNKVNILALGDVGTTMLIGLRLMGSSHISEIGICDINEANVERLEQEINQINYPFGLEVLPDVKAISSSQLFDCDVFIFCASKGVPPIGQTGDVRMAQLNANREIIAHYGKLAKDSEYKGMIAVVSDPVDPLCKEMLRASGLNPSQIQGYGLGVMNARALYFAKKFGFPEYEEKGRAFGPHGSDLVIANDIENYNEKTSIALTERTINANMQVRELGYKPYIAPAMSSAAISILLTMSGQWHYSSLYFGDEENGGFLGIKNKMTAKGPEYEDLEICDELYNRIKKAYINLYNIK